MAYWATVETWFLPRAFWPAVPLLHSLKAAVLLVPSEIVAWVVRPPNGLSCEYDTQGFQPDGAITAGSRHPGGVNVMMMDGSVRFAKSTINVATWQAIGTIAGTEVVSSDAF